MVLIDEVDVLQDILIATVGFNDGDVDPKAFFSWPTAFSRCWKVLGFSATLDPSTTHIFETVMKTELKTICLDHAKRSEPKI